MSLADYRTRRKLESDGKTRNDIRQVFIERAKLRVEKNYSCKPGDRRWLAGSPPDSYESETYRVELLVLEGSPPKGFVLATHNAVLALCFDGRVLRRWDY